jgi:hypothetical protein
MNPTIDKTPIPLTGDLELPDGRVVPGCDVFELLELLKGPRRARHMCISKGHLQELTGQLLVENRLLQKQVARLQAELDEIKSNARECVTVGGEALLKMTDEEMAQFQALIDNDSRRLIHLRPTA